MRASSRFAPLLVLLAHPAAASVYVLDAAESEILIHTDRGGFLAFAGHRHVIRAMDFEGRITWDDDTSAPAGITVRIVAESLRVRDGDLSPGDVAKVQRDMEQEIEKRKAQGENVISESFVVSYTPAWHVSTALLGLLVIAGVADGSRSAKS